VKFVPEQKMGTMANKSIIMIEVRRILQMHNSGASKHKIAKTLHLHRKTVGVYLTKFAATGKIVPELISLSDQELRCIIYAQPFVPDADSRFLTLEPMFAGFVAELRKTGVTRKLLWEDYKALHPAGYGYTQFCEHLARFLLQSKAAMHFTHLAGEYLQVDFAGKSLFYIDRQTGEQIACPVLVCTLPASNYTYVEALACAKQEYLFAALNRCLEFFGGVPKNILSDNMKQYVQKNERYEFTFQELALQWSVHYNTNLDATRPRKPKDKPTVEGHVHLSYLRIYAKLRREEFFSLAELNQGIQKHLTVLNSTGFQKLPGSRLQRFIEHEQAHLHSLPAQAFTIKHTTSAKVQMNYHVILGQDAHQYSVPFGYIGKQTTLVYDHKTVEIFIGQQRIAIHARSTKRNAYTTLKEHMPANHAFYTISQGWDAEYFIAFAKKVGTSAEAVMTTVLESRDFVQQTYKACIGLKQLALRYGNLRFEAACKRALQGTWINYGVVKNILQHNLDRQPLPENYQTKSPEHENIRGEKLYN